ncbi:hypothetical protein WQQ_25630 [Hydrocarboniphaga effusa AP103]|jgi:two-component system sensor histidine kinase UhpB|uniref:Oxygen sensor histidine kinase NreB n=1 Tax=Hydrocarboniphaga effusa AP103 TaxID=1172194 RepID=I8HZH8_9GAMM|nr:hypothetical protein WQQ_25630 [Hydrocarboniphaga effusa AP103]
MRSHERDPCTDAGKASEPDGRSGRLSLRLRINLMIAGLMLVFIAVVLATQILATRKSVLEETRASNSVAVRLLSAFISPDDVQSNEVLRATLQRLGRVRSTEIVLRDALGQVVYSSPPSTYKAGRSAPRWYARLVSPAPIEEGFILRDGALSLQSNASRAVLDGWDDTKRLLLLGLASLLLVQPLVLWLVGRATQPLREIVVGLESMERGAYHTRLPKLPSKESDTIGQAFNRMAQAIEDNIDARREAAEATVNLRRSRELANLVELRMEDERRQIARELHDETSQSVTAIHSLALSLSRRELLDEEARRVAGTIAAAAGHLHGVVHEMIPRLRPLALDNLGLADAVQNQIDDWRMQHEGLRIEGCVEDLPEELDERVTLAAFRLFQEACSNALRHAQASHIDVRMATDGDSLVVQVRDDGIGLPDDWRSSRGYGLRGMRERVQTLGGELAIERRHPRGTRVSARLPLKVSV